jgi:hypothetical protein
MGHVFNLFSKQLILDMSMWMGGVVGYYDISVDLINIANFYYS